MVIFNKLNNKKGFMSIYIIVMLAVLIPIMFFLTIDLPYMMRMNRTLKSALDNATSTAITYLNESKISAGILEIDVNEANRVVNKVIQEYFYLNDDLTTNEDSLIDGTPKIEIQVINNPTGQRIDTPNGGTIIKNPSVVVYAEFPVKAKFSGITKTIKHTSVSQVQFKK